MTWYRISAVINEHVQHVFYIEASNPTKAMEKLDGDDWADQRKSINGAERTIEEIEAVVNSTQQIQEDQNQQNDSYLMRVECADCKEEGSEVTVHFESDMYTEQPDEDTVLVKERILVVGPPDTSNYLQEFSKLHRPKGCTVIKLVKVGV